MGNWKRSWVGPTCALAIFALWGQLSGVAQALVPPETADMKPEVQADTFTGIAENPAIDLPPVQDEFSGVKFSVGMRSVSGVDVEQMTGSMLFFLSAASVPTSLVIALTNPFAVFGIFFPVVAPPANFILKSQVETLTDTVNANPLPGLVMTAIRANWDADRVYGLAEVRVSIFDYGLRTRSGKPISLFESGDDLCLVAAAEYLIISDDAVESMLQARIGDQEAGLPPAVCAAIGAFVDDDGAYLQLAIRELAVILSLVLLNGVEEQQ